MRAEVIGGSEVGGECGGALSFELYTVMKLVSFGSDNKFPQSKMAFKNVCKITIRSLWLAQFRKAVLSFGADDRYQSCCAFESFSWIRWNTVRDKILPKKLEITIDISGGWIELFYFALPRHDPSLISRYVMFSGYKSL